MRVIAILAVLLASLLPSVASAEAPDAVVVFIQGYGSSTVKIVEDDSFGSVKGMLRNSGWTDDQLVTFGYRGTAYWRDQAGGYRWLTSAYGCPDTQSGLDPADELLSGTLRAIMNARPSSRIVLVGHSFGGLLAWYHLNKVVGGQRPTDVDGVLAIDAPMRGISAGRGFVATFDECSGLDGKAMDQMLGFRTLWQQQPGTWPAIKAAARARGIAAFSFGSDADCVYNAGQCGWPIFGDETDAQIVPGAGMVLRPSWRPTDIRRSHSAMLYDPTTLSPIVATIQRQAQGKAD